MRISRNERGGSAPVELIIVVPAIVMMMGLLMAGGRIWMAESATQQAAGAAARAASIARTAGQAHNDSHAVAEASLSSEGLECANFNTDVDTSGFQTPVGTSAQVTATVSCTVTFSDLLLKGMPGSRTIHATGSAPLDTYRERQ